VIDGNLYTNNSISKTKGYIPLKTKLFYYNIEALGYSKYFGTLLEKYRERHSTRKTIHILMGCGDHPTH